MSEIYLPSRKERELPSAGTQFAVCCGIIELGTQPTTYGHANTATCAEPKLPLVSSAIGNGNGRHKIRSCCDRGARAKILVIRPLIALHGARTMGNDEARR